MTTGRIILTVGVALLVGFVGGIWSFSSGLMLALMPLPTVSTPIPLEQKIDRKPVRVPRSGVLSDETVQNRARLDSLALPNPNVIDGERGLGKLITRTDLLPSPGSSWEIEPREFLLDREWYRGKPDRFLIGVPSFEPKTGQLRYSLIQGARDEKLVVPLRLVIFDAKGNRFAARVTRSWESSAAGSKVEQTHHDWNELPEAKQEQFAYFGVERLIPEVNQQLVEAARLEAREKGIPLLQQPRIGEPFEFDLPTIDGKRIRSADLKGKAILLVIGGPVLTRPLIDKRSLSGLPVTDLVVVGISFDALDEDAVKNFQRLADSSTLVHVPNDQTVRRLWLDGVGIAHLPSYWIIDRAGILRFQVPWYNIVEPLKMALGLPTSQEEFEEFVHAKQAKAKAGSPSTRPVMPRSLSDQPDRN